MKGPPEKKIAAPTNQDGGFGKRENIDTAARALQAWRVSGTNDAEEIKRAVARNAADFAAWLFPGGKRNGSKWHVGDVTGAPGKSLAIDLDGEFAGHYRDWSGDERGDSIALVMAARGIDFVSAMRLLRERYGIATPSQSLARCCGRASALHKGQGRARACNGGAKPAGVAQSGTRKPCGLAASFHGSKPRTRRARSRERTRFAVVLRFAGRPCVAHHRPRTPQRASPSSRR